MLFFLTRAVCQVLRCGLGGLLLLFFTPATVAGAVASGSVAGEGIERSSLGSGPNLDELGELRTKLRNSNKYVRKDAVDALGKRTEVEAWSLLIDALGDRSGEVADSAAFLLGSMPEGGDFEDLREDLERDRGLTDKSEQVRRYAAELLGRMGGPHDFATMAKALKDKDPITRRLLLFSFERLLEQGSKPGDARAKLEKAVLRAFERDKDFLVRARALHVLAALGESAPAGRSGFDRTLAEACTDSSPEVRAAAALLLGSVPGKATGLPAFMGRLAADDAFPVRTAALRALVQVVRGEGGFPLRKAALELLVLRLEQEESPTISWRCMTELHALTGFKYKDDVRPWRDWLRTLAPDWLPRAVGQVEREEQEELRGSESSATIVGLPIRSEAVAFVIDFSGSTWRENDGGRTIKMALEEKLREALEALPPGTRFLLVPFTNVAKPWREELVEATPRNVQNALGWFEKAQFKGPGNAWEAMLFAQDVVGVDTIVMLSDGAPSGGSRYRLEQISAMFLERNLGRQVILDCVLVGAGKRIRGFWGELSLATGGRMLAVKL
ncbi:MAG: HEAT repeat protein [Planctomycetota bacterium]|jgi:HEAT repeat protein